MLCDFCNATNPSRTYECESFESFRMVKKDETITGESDGQWSACERCAKLVDAKDWEALADAAMETLEIKPSTEAERLLLRNYVKNLHQQFQHHRKMDAPIADGNERFKSTQVGRYVN